MAAENALQPDPHRDGAKNPAEQLQDVPLYTSSAAIHKKQQPSSSLSAMRPQRPPVIVTTEKTPLVLKIDTSRRTQSSAEEVHPLPWFRSPEWGARKSDSRATGGKNGGASQKRRRNSSNSANHKNSGWWCFGKGSGAATNGDRDLEIGVYSQHNHHHRAVGSAADDADGFRQCIQFLVALILVVAIALIFMIIFQPFHEGSSASDGFIGV